MLSVAVAWSSSDDVTICYVLPVCGLRPVYFEVRQVAVPVGRQTISVWSSLSECGTGTKFAVYECLVKWLQTLPEVQLSHRDRETCSQLKTCLVPYNYMKNRIRNSFQNSNDIRSYSCLRSSETTRFDVYLALQSDIYLFIYLIIKAKGYTGHLHCSKTYT